MHLLQENLCDLNARLSGAGEAELPMNRFRPNIVLAGGGSAWSDDNWHSITISSSAGDSSSEGSQVVVLQYVMPCSRCKVSCLYGLASLAFRRKPAACNLPTVRDPHHLRGG